MSLTNQLSLSLFLVSLPGHSSLPTSPFPILVYPPPDLSLSFPIITIHFPIYPNLYLSLLKLLNSPNVPHNWSHPAPSLLSLSCAFPLHS